MSAPDDTDQERVISLTGRIRAAGLRVTLRRARVFLIDDQSIGRNILREIVLQLDRQTDVEVFADAREALDAARARIPDLVLTDYLMPEMDGIEFIRHFRCLAGCEDVPVVVVTVAEERRVRYEALEAGATEFLNRPVDRQECVARCRNLLLLRDHQLILEQRARAFEQGAATRHGERRAAAVGEGGGPVVEACVAHPERRLLTPPGEALALQRLAIPIRELVAEVVRFFCPEAAGVGIESVAEVVPQVPARIWGDERYLRYLLVNLLGDATEFAADGQLRMRVFPLAQSPRDARLRFEVTASAEVAGDGGSYGVDAGVPCPQVLRRRHGDRGPDIGTCERLVLLLAGRYGRHCGVRSRTTWFSLTFEVECPVLMLGQGQALARLVPWLNGWGFTLEGAESVPDAFHRILSRSRAGEPYRFILVEETALGVGPEFLGRSLAGELAAASTRLVLVAPDVSAERVSQARAAGYSAVVSDGVESSALFRILASGSGSQTGEAIRTLPGPGRPARPALHVLVCSDRGPARSRLQRTLLAAGHRVDVATDGEELLDRIVEVPYDAVVLDRVTDSDRLYITGIQTAQCLGVPIVQVTDDDTDGQHRIAGAVPLARGRTEDLLGETLAQALRSRER